MSFDILQNNDYDIILLEDCPCENKDQLSARERYYIESLNCINKIIPGRTDKEYYENNKEKFSQKNKDYFELNKDQIKTYRKQYRLSP